ncbi:ATP-dependent RNA helicase DEAH11, chloroplastic-like [Gigantopelta aegis]|uniref:ATP-dependent RNA helicase DEAH11, chloroplastic-like n=1 Tax=Gigantopelta aegis TaxID=1735272 RepID=UPI001B88A968|nr:ATP-dependent RNA helicase DEAH11, chloroplastic-like [Gigantopelta aegis]
MNVTGNQCSTVLLTNKDADLQETDLETDELKSSPTSDPGDRASKGNNQVGLSSLVVKETYQGLNGPDSGNRVSPEALTHREITELCDEKSESNAKSSNKENDSNNKVERFQTVATGDRKSKLAEAHIHSSSEKTAKLEMSGFTESEPLSLVKSQTWYNSAFTDVPLLDNYETKKSRNKIKKQLRDLEPQTTAEKSVSSSKVCPNLKAEKVTDFHLKTTGTNNVKSKTMLEQGRKTKTKSPVGKTLDMEGSKFTSPKLVSTAAEKICNSKKTEDKSLKKNTKTKVGSYVNLENTQTETKSSSSLKTSPKPKSEKIHNSLNNGGRLSKQDQANHTKPVTDKDMARKTKMEKMRNPQKTCEKLLKQEKKNKKTCLYLQFDQLMKDNNTIHRFLTTRLRKSDGEVSFEIMESVRKMDENYTVVTLKFSSKHVAHTAQNLLNLSNRNNELKIFSTFDPSEVDDSKKVSRNKAVFRQQLTDIVTRAEQTMNKHEDKMTKTDDSLLKLKSSKRMSNAEFEMVISQRYALEDKLKELTLQRAECQEFLKSLLVKLEQCWEDNKYDKNINEILKLFRVECRRLETALPMYAQRKEIVKLVTESQVCVILGETGSGKSTQVTQFLYQVGFGNDGIIVCTQPRKVAAISLATRVASEMDTSVGQVVGYRVGMKSKFGGNTKILYMTDHALLNDCLQDPTLSKYSCVIIDEAHERSIYTDLLLGMVKRCISGRPELKVIITSATIDPDIFVQYFNGCPVLKVSGRTFPVDVIWQPVGHEVDIFENYLEAAVQKVVEIHRTEPEGDVLVFMTTPLETERCRDSFRQKLKNDNSYRCLVLHGQVQMTEQQLVFQPTPRGQRKIVFATNSAETSITIPGIKYVVDTGLVKEKRYDPKRNMDSLNVYMISRSSADQRKGRAGRTGPGTCYRLYSKELYQSMESSSSPEILKVHLGQAMLKLAELGVSPQEYDFVQSPDKSAIADAIKLLEDIGAMKNQLITETGKWLTKLPLEPRHGMIIAKGKEHNTLYEAIILSAVSSAGSSIFYRGGSQNDKRKADLLKLKFCHNGGDSLTLLNVFREWDKQPERRKNAWCFENSINSKAIRGVRDTVNEIRSLLKKELDLAVKHSVGDSSKTDKILQKILFECFSSNICHFLGHEKAGYYAARLDQLVHIHPSSALNPLALLPQWVIFEQVLKTSKDFVTGLTPVDDSTVTAAVENGTLPYNIEEMKQKQVHQIHTECVGSRAFWSIVGPAFSKLRILEEKADQLAAPSVAVIEADKEKGEFTIFSTDDCSAKLTDLFKPDIAKVRAELEHEDAEYSLSEQAGAVKVIIGMGGEVLQVLMPDDYRTVIIKRPDDDTTESVVMEKFGQYGLIKACREFSNWNNDRWGCVTFEQTADAKRAVDDTEDDQYEVAVAGNRGKGGERLAFKAKLTWCRRKSRQFAYVDISPAAQDEYIKLLAESPILINEKEVNVNPNKRGLFSLYLNRLSADTDERAIESALLRILDHGGDTSVIEKVNVVREQVVTTTDMLDTFTSCIKAAIRQCAPSEEFTVEVMQPKPQWYNYLAFAHFRHPEEGQRACRMLSKDFTMSSFKDMTMIPDISAELRIQSNVMKVIREELEDAFDDLSHLKDITTLRLKELRNGSFVVDIHATCTEQMAEVRSVLQDIVQGDVLEYRNCRDLKHMFTKNGRKHLASLQSKLKCLIVVDNRTMTISIKGNSKVRNKVGASIDDFLKAIAEGTCKEIYLKGPNRPGGVMKKLTLKYEIDLEKFRKEMGLLSVDMDFRRHKLELRGSTEAIEKAEAIIETITTELARDLSVKLQNDKRPECVACFMPVERGQLYRLEACGHAYCTDCVKQQFQVALMDKDFPVDCVHEQCGLHFMWRDVFNFIRDGSIVIKELVAASVSAFVAKHQKDYRYCITPDCPVIYRVSPDGSPFDCCECQTKVCTSCHVQYHDGLSCAMNKSPDKEGDRLFKVWMDERKNRKLCPNCDAPIEKKSGCNKIRCYACKEVFCWICQEVFASGQKCYAHLQKMHGGFY